MGEKRVVMCKGVCVSERGTKQEERIKQRVREKKYDAYYDGGTRLVVSNTHSRTATNPRQKKHTHTDVLYINMPVFVCLAGGWEPHRDTQRDTHTHGEGTNNNRHGGNNRRPKKPSQKPPFTTTHCSISFQCCSPFYCGFYFFFFCPFGSC